MNKIHNWINSGLIVLVGILVLVGNQSVPNIGDLGRVGTEFESGLRTSWFQTPSENISNVTVFSTTRRCQIGSAVNFCNVQNNSGVRWYVQPRLLISLRGTATTTFSQHFVATSTTAFAGGGTAFLGLQYAVAPLKAAIGSTTGYSTLNITGDRVFANLRPYAIGEGTSTTPFILEVGQYLNCGVLALPKNTGGKTVGKIETATSTKFNITTECIFDIFATSTPKLGT